MSSTITQIAKELYELRTEESQLSEQLKLLKKKIDSVEEKLISEMVHEELQRVDLAGKASFHIATKHFYKIADRQQLLDFLHDNGDEDIITVNHNTLNAYAKEMRERKAASGDEEFEIPGVSFVSKTEIRVRKVNK